MCGLIAGIGNVSLTTLDKAVATLTHRGPESSETWVSEKRSMFLGHTRLSIIGLDNGAQPISNADGNVHIVVNGEFYGYKQIRERLLSEGVVFKTESDSEIALHLYLRYGLEALKELRGEFAIVIADERQNCLIAIRDRFGIKPLFYTVHQGAVYLRPRSRLCLRLASPPAGTWKPHFTMVSFSATMPVPCSRISGLSRKASMPSPHRAISNSTHIGIGTFRPKRPWHWTPAAMRSASRNSARS